MTKRRKKADVKISKTKGLETDLVLEDPVVEKLEPIVDEEPDIVKQPFSEPVVNDIPEEVFQQAKLYDAIRELPEPLFTYTQKSMGEDFMPTYARLRSKLRRLAGIS